MTMGMTILKGLLIGICASAPLGPVGILVLQKSLCHGFKNGFVTGLGAALTDTIYAIIAIFFLAITQDFLERNQILFLIVGGVVVTALGISMALKNPFRMVKAETEEDVNAGRKKFSFAGFFQSIAICVTNPGAILIMFSLFTAFGVDVEPGNPYIIPLLIAVSGGCALWWLGFTSLFSIWSKRIKLQTFVLMNRIFGLLLAITGIGILAWGIIKKVL